MPQQPFALYNPALLQPDDLLAQFTARLPMLETLLGVIRGNKTGQPPQHCLLIGARGMGKTTTLWAVAHRVNRDATLACDWQPVVFDEESRRVGDLADFWLECIRQWEHVTQSPGALADQLLADAPADIEDRARETFLRLVDQSRRRALLLIDNLNEVLSSISNPEPLHRLRAFLMQDSRVMVIGGATRYFDEITSMDQPFYDFFRCFELRALTAEGLPARSSEEPERRLHREDREDLAGTAGHRARPASAHRRQSPAGGNVLLGSVRAMCRTVVPGPAGPSFSGIDPGTT